MTNQIMRYSDYINSIIKTDKIPGTIHYSIER